MRQDLNLRFLVAAELEVNLTPTARRLSSAEAPSEPSSVGFPPTGLQLPPAELQATGCIGACRPHVQTYKSYSPAAPTDWPALPSKGPRAT